MPTDLYNLCSGGVDDRALGFKFLVLAMMAMVSWGRKDQRHRQGPVSRSEVLGQHEGNVAGWPGAGQVALRPRQQHCWVSTRQAG